MIEHKDAVLAVLGASAGLSGFLLVFLGLLVTSYQSFPSDTPESVKGKYRSPGVAALASFGVGLLCVILAVFWIVEGNDLGYVYVATIVAFVCQVIGSAVSTAMIARRTLWA